MTRHSPVVVSVIGLLNPKKRDGIRAEKALVGTGQDDVAKAMSQPDDVDALRDGPFGYGGHRRGL